MPHFPLIQPKPPVSNDDGAGLSSDAATPKLRKRIRASSAKVDDDTVSKRQCLAQEPTSNSGRSARQTKRQATIAACDACQRRKIKCYGERPACSMCLQRRIACEYATDATETHAQALKRKLANFENEIKLYRQLFEDLQTKDDRYIMNIVHRIRTGSNIHTIYQDANDQPDVDNFEEPSKGVQADNSNPDRKFLTNSATEMGAENMEGRRASVSNGAGAQDDKQESVLLDTQSRLSSTTPTDCREPFSSHANFHPNDGGLLPSQDSLDETQHGCVSRPTQLPDAHRPSDSGVSTQATPRFSSPSPVRVWDLSARERMKKNDYGNRMSIEFMIEPRPAGWPEQVAQGRINGPGV
ncbi:hypothetical protein QBC47DRAFT_36696 [Echria macrotheca]|uniref:Zn(2)-C6 fungal-type domain-containing protein n=1 Tax=Echria macrotheca TaxID=438768 RepID=A0AAJ0BA91_9PEZI|nr:hypothetical protein QBC47DRAFT_36696 [Echria macrotheca]